MKRKKINKKLNYQPTKLQKHKLENPFDVMDYFFHDFPIHETRDNLWELYKGWVYNSSQYANEQITKDMLCFYTQFSEFLDACYVFTSKKAK
ncbi:hypothetical protein [Pedobacter cryoconitis]|uniref:hypothetical protein n=1 Tax=Pedobacter cryoconitis TaxID=188932 RepID=UPI0016186483|nr:hypothetical protein [Pedobacter cryoconitis]MBB5645899.1 hypothetical protein [Pedobacter cryoconitis]